MKKSIVLFAFSILISTTNMFAQSVNSTNDNLGFLDVWNSYRPVLTLISGVYIKPSSELEWDTRNYVRREIEAMSRTSVPLEAGRYDILLRIHERGASSSGNSVRFVSFANVLINKNEITLIDVQDGRPSNHFIADEESRTPITRETPRNEPPPTTFAENELTNKKGVPILPRAGTVAFGIDASPFLRYTAGFISNTIPNAPTFDGLTFYRKKFIRDDMARRFGMRLNWNFNNVGDTTTSGLDVIFSIGREKRLNWNSNNRLQGFTGFEFISGFGSAGNRVKTPNSLYRPGTKFTIGGNTFIGAEYFIAPGLAIGGQVGYGINLTFKSESIFEEEHIEDPIRTKGGAIFNLANFGVGITLMFHF
jgi:hypothetical protein